MSLANPLFRRFLIASAAAVAMAGCNPGVDGDDGTPVDQLQPVTNTFGFDVDTNATFVVGTAPETASFAGGLTRNGKWIIRDGTTGTVVFASPPRQVSFDLEAPAVPAAAAMQPAAFMLQSNGSCGVPDAGLDNGEAFGGQLYLRGEFNDWGSQAEWGFINTGGGVYQLEHEFAAGEYAYKIAQQAWDVFDRAVLGENTLPNVTYVTADPGPGGPNGNLVIPSAGCWNITLDANDLANVTLLMTAVTDGGDGGGKTVCGVGNQGLDDGEAFGDQLFMRGSFSDWAARSQLAFFNFGGGIYQAEFELAAGAYPYKIAQQAWDVFDRAVLGQDTVPGPALPLSDPGPGGPNGNLVLSKAACWNFLIDANDLGNMTLRVTEVDLSGGGPPPFVGAEIRLFAPDGEAIGSEQVAGGETAIDRRIQLSRTGSQAPIGRIEIASVGGAGDLFVDNFSWTVNPRDAGTPEPVTIYYHRPDGDYSDTQIVIDGRAYDCVPTALGCSVTVEAVPNSTISFDVLRGGVADPTGPFTATVGSSGQSIYAFSGNPEALAGDLQVAPGENEVLLFYRRADGEYDGWAVHLFPTGLPDWTLFNPGLCVFQGVDPVFGAYFRITLPPNPCYDANPPALTRYSRRSSASSSTRATRRIPVRTSSSASQSWATSCSSIPVSPPSIPAPPSGARLSVAGRGRPLGRSRHAAVAPADGTTSVELLWSPDGGISPGVGELSGNFEAVALAARRQPRAGQPASHRLAAGLADSLPRSRGREVAAAPAARRRGARPLRRRRSTPPTCRPRACSTHLWRGRVSRTPRRELECRQYLPSASGRRRPTSRPGVTLTLYSDAQGTVAEQVPMTLDPATGVWSASGSERVEPQATTISRCASGPTPPKPSSPTGSRTRGR
jgi:hypothetical protein